ncbi:MAG: hypothetical protein ACQSGP_15040 [Frankia sp.]
MSLAPALPATVRAVLEPVLGPVAVSMGERLTSSERNLVVRAVARDAGGRDHPLVVKMAVGAGDGSVREEAALLTLAAHRVPNVVRVLATGSVPPLLILDDLGRSPTVADRLLGTDPEAARAAVIAWAEALASLHGATTGLRTTFADGLAARSPLGAPNLDTSAETVAEAIGTLRRVLPRFDVPLPAAAVDELRAIPPALDVAGGGPGAITPGDTCPSNAVETADGMTLIDFEGAEFRHVAWDAAYLRVPWPSCWCSWRLPAAVAAGALDRWRGALAPSVPYVASAAFDLDLIKAAFAWVFISAGWFLGPALDGDPPPPDPARRALVPRRRELLAHRLRWVAEQADSPLPALRELAGALGEATRRRWGEQPLPLAPAFR